ncbi:MAG: hypothetical protein WBK77_07615 [Alphaproteobacteria bacterium]
MKPSLKYAGIPVLLAALFAENAMAEQEGDALTVTFPDSIATNFVGDKCALELTGKKIVDLHIGDKEIMPHREFFRLPRPAQEEIEQKLWKQDVEFLEQYRICKTNEFWGDALPDPQ